MHTHNLVQINAQRAAGQSRSESSELGRQGRSCLERLQLPSTLVERVQFLQSSVKPKKSILKDPACPLSFSRASFGVCLFNPSSFPHTCEISPFLFLQLSSQKMLHSNKPMSFTNAVWKPKQSHCSLRWWGIRNSEGFLKSQFLDCAAQIR